MMIRCPYADGCGCCADLQPVMFEGVLSMAAGIAQHLQVVHRYDQATAWHVANDRAARARAR